jgi:hypothetical protein
MKTIITQNEEIDKVWICDLINLAQVEHRKVIYAVSKVDWGLNLGPHVC